MREFLAVSMALTGFSRLELLGTGLVEEHAAFLERRLGPAFRAFLDEGGPPEHPLAAVVTRLWYTGTYAYEGVEEVPSARAYAEALVWQVLGVPAPGTRPTGFGSWA